MNELPNQSFQRAAWASASLQSTPPLSLSLGGYISDIQSHNKTSEEVAVQLQGVIIGRYIELLHKTDLPDGLPVTVDIRPESFSLEKKRRLVDELCGSWADDSTLKRIFTEIGHTRRDSGPREVNFDATS